ncbi:hypothetical protein GBAR_LOCUS19914, partial [Geodia barretti]
MPRDSGVIRSLSKATSFFPAESKENWIRSAKAEGVGVVDVDGTYLERKRQSLVSSNVNVAPLPPPNFPLHGWQSVEESNAEQIATQLPCQRCIL